MRVEFRTKTRTVTDNFKVYISDDGKEFQTERECRKYEKEQMGTDRMKTLSKYIIGFDGIPLHADDCYSSSMYYTWFKVNNAQELHEIEDTINDSSVIPVPVGYPYYFCFETEYEFEGQNPDYVTSIDNCIYNAIEFFKEFDDIDINIQRKEVICES